MTQERDSEPDGSATGAAADPRARIEALPIWSGPVSPEPLSGGLSNVSFTVADAGARRVVRIGRDYPFHHVDRAREAMIARAAHAAGFGPEVFWSEPGLAVTAFVEARTCGEEDVRAAIAPLAELLRGFHDTMPRHVTGPAFLFWPFHVIRDYARQLEAAGSPHAGSLPDRLALAERLEAEQVPLPIRFAHNDLLPANILDDGERLWLIDYEYAGFSTPMFDLAGLASNAGFDEADDAALLTAYFGKAPDGDLLRSHSAMKCASLLREAMWSMVSEIHLDTPGIDFEAYTQENLDRLGRALADHERRFGEG